MRKSIKFLSVILLACLLFGCETEVVEFDRVKDAIETVEKESKEAEEEAIPKEKSAADRLNNPDTLNIDNSERLKTLLTTTVSKEEYYKFVEDNQYNIIEFDGAIDLIELVSGKKTRYSMILRAGEYSENSIVGPGFIVKDVGASDASVSDLFRAGLGRVGQSVKIAAEMKGVDKGSELIELKLISISER